MEKQDLVISNREKCEFLLHAWNAEHEFAIMIKGDFQKNHKRAKKELNQKYGDMYYDIITCCEKDQLKYTFD